MQGMTISCKGAATNERTWLPYTVLHCIYLKTEGNNKNTILPRCNVKKCHSTFNIHDEIYKDKDLGEE